VGDQALVHVINGLFLDHDDHLGIRRVLRVAQEAYVLCDEIG
jgi:hypothetical protein